MSASLPVRVDVSDRIATLTIDNPPANTLSVAVVDALAAAFRQVLADPEVKVIVLTGAGSLFSAGANVRELAALQDRSQAERCARNGQALCDLVETSSKPVIAALNGRYVLGGGAELAVACHLRVIEESTQFGNPEVQLGLMVGWGGSQRLPRLVGLGVGLELLLTGRRVAAREALSLGLVNRVVADGTSLTEAIALARTLARLSGPVLAATLDVVRTGVRLGFAAGIEAEASAFARLSENKDWREGTRAFLEKREPTFGDH